MSLRQEEKTPAAVPFGASLAGETRGRWSWVEPSVWTQRMLTALEEGVKGGKWSIISGPTPTLLSLGCSPTAQPMLRPVNPQ